MAIFGADSGQPFDELNKVLQEIFTSAHMLGSCYWKKRAIERMSDEKHQEFLEQMQKHEAKFWSMTTEPDEITLKVKQAVEKIEEITKETSLNTSIKKNQTLAPLPNGCKKTMRKFTTIHNISR